MITKRLSEKILLVFLLGFLSLEAFCAGPIPFFRNFSPSEYDAMSQNWAVTQDSRGYIYAGNSSCLLRFNGRSWDKLYPFGERKDAIIRSLFSDPESGRIYVGSFREFGYLEYDEYGKMVFTSLYDRLPDKGGDSDEIWYITKINRQIFFIYFTSLYIYDLDTEEVRMSGISAASFWNLDDYLHIVSGTGNIRRFDGKGNHYEDLPCLDVQGVIKVFPGSGTAKISVSSHDGLYRTEDGRTARIDNLGSSWGVANRAIQCADGSVIVGFISSGVYAFGPDGELLWHISSEDGLIDNTVLALYEDDCGNIWCALDKGVAVIFRGGDLLLPMAGYGLGKTSVSLCAGDELFIGSNQGLARFKLDYESLALKKNGSWFQDTQLWSLYEKDGQIFVGENGSSYIFSDGSFHYLSNAPGGVTPKTIVLRDGSEMLIQGSFTLLYVYVRENGKWRLSHTVDGFMHPVKNLEVDYLGNIWIEHMYRGLYRIVLSDDGRSLRSETMYPIEGARLCKMGGRVLFHNKNGFHYYDEEASVIKPFGLMNTAVGEYRSCNRVIPAGMDRYWLVRKKGAALVGFHNDEVQLLDAVNFDNLNVSLTERFETVLSLPGDRFLFGLEDGFLIHDYKKGEDNKAAASIGFSEIQSFCSDSLHTLSLLQDRITIPCNSSLYITMFMNGIKYYNADIWYELSSYDYEPRLLDKSMTASYQRLRSGSYTFHAWIDDGRGGRAAEISIPVTVKPSVFASPPAILIYVIAALAAAYAVWHYIQRALKRQRLRLESEKEKEIITMRNEQLEEAVLLKSKELATYSLIEARRNQVLQRLREELGKMRYGRPAGISKADYDKMMSMIHEGEFSEDEWTHFYNNFDLIHQSFFRILAERHPGLTSNDLRICAYLRLNLSTKELADVMGVTIKGAEAAKYRLRKKLNVDTAIPLHEYLTKIGK